MKLLRQSTEQVVQFGPFVDIADGVTLETGLATAMDNATTGIRVSKDGAAYADRNSATAPSYDAMGDYRITLSTTDTNTVGILKMIFEEAATCLPVWQEFMVVSANVYDALTGADTLDVNVIEWLGTAAATPTTAGVPEVDVTHLGGATQSATDLKDFADAGYDPATNKVQGVVLVDTTTTTTTATNLTNLPTIPANWLTAAGIAASALDGKGDWNTVVPDAAGVAPTAAENATQVWEELTATARTAGTYGQLIKDDIDATISSRATSAKQDTMETTLNAAATTAELDKVPKSDGAVSWNATALGDINTQVDTAIETYGLDHLISSALPTNWATDVASGSVFDNIADDGTAVFDRTTDSLQAIADAGATDPWGVALPGSYTAGEAGYILGHQVDQAGTCQAGSTASTIKLASGAVGASDDLNGNLVYIISGTGAGQAPRTITDSTITTDVCDINPDWVTTPDGTTTYQILPANNGALVVGSDNKVILSSDAHTGAVIPTVTTLTNLPTIPTDWLTAAGTAADFTTEVVAGMNDLDAAGIRSAVGLASANMDTQFTASATATGFATSTKQDTMETTLNDVPTTAEFEARTLLAASYFDPAADTVANVTTVGSVTGSVGSNLELGPSEVNAEVVDALATDTYAEPAQGAPGATISLADKINFLYKAWRNRSTQTSTTYSLYNDDATTVDHKATVSDDATTADKGEVATGP